MTFSNSLIIVVNQQPVATLNMAEILFKTRHNLFECLLIHSLTSTNGVKMNFIYTFCEQPRG